MPLSKKRAKQVQPKQGQKALVAKLELDLAEAVQPKIGQEWIENGEYRRVNAEGKIEDGWGVVPIPNRPDGRYRGDR